MPGTEIKARPTPDAALRLPSRGGDRNREPSWNIQSNNKNVVRARIAGIQNSGEETLNSSELSALR
jgi:hypothetical protein